MRAFLIVGVLLLVGIGGLGFYRGWFQISSTRDNTENTVDTTFTVDETKIQEDKHKLQELGRQAKDETAEALDQSE